MADIIVDILLLAVVLSAGIFIFVLSKNDKYVGARSRRRRRWSGESPPFSRTGSACLAAAP